MTVLQLVVASLAVYRVARMVATEPGPYLWRSEPRGVFARLRAAVTDEYDQHGQPTGFLPSLLGCPACLSVWIGLLAALWLAFGPAWGWWLLSPFALSGAATWLFALEPGEE